MTVGPIGVHGFGYWYSCDASVAWTNGQLERFDGLVNVFCEEEEETSVVVSDAGSFLGTHSLAAA